MDRPSQLDAISNILLGLARELRKGRELPGVRRDAHDDRLRAAAVECHAVLAEVAGRAEAALHGFRFALLRTQASRLRACVCEYVYVCVCV